jgi:hypothetical protein
MTTYHHTHYRSLKPMLTAASAAIAVLSIVTCAAATPVFNPGQLPKTQLSRVDEVCRNVMGLSPSERLIGGEWEGNSDLDYWTSRYRGCVTSLSYSTGKVSDSQTQPKAHRALPLPTASGSLFYASARETRRREEEACEAVGIEPKGDAFDACVNDLENTFHAIDTPIT